MNKKNQSQKLIQKEGKDMKWFSLAEIYNLSITNDKKAILPYVFTYHEKFKELMK